MTSRWKTIWEAVSTLAMVLIASTMLVLYMRGGRSTQSTAADEPSMPPHAGDWRTWVDAAIEVGPDAAPVVIAEFVDLTCPFCRRLAPVIDSVLVALGERVRFQFIHFPLPGHENAVPRAIALECADRQGAAWAMLRVLFQHDEAGSERAWEDLASEAGVPDPGGLQKCTEFPVDSFPRIEAGRTLGRRVGVFYTPTFFINGNPVGNPTTVADFAAAVEELTGAGGRERGR